MVDTILQASALTLAIIVAGLTLHIRRALRR